MKHYLKRLLLAATAVALFVSPLLHHSGREGQVAEQDFPAAAGSAFHSESFVNNEIPGAMSHVSTVARDGRGGMVCAWYSGSREGARDVSIYLARLDRDTLAWSRPEILMDRKRSSRELGRYVKKLGNPVLVSGLDGRLWLFYASVFQGGWSGASINYAVSEDGGRTWGKSRKLLLSPFFNLTNNVKNRGLVLDDGTILIPVYHEFIKDFSQLLRFRPAGGAARHEDRYEIRKMTSRGQAIQPTLIHEGGERLLALFRNKANGHVLMSRSDDLGMSWSALEASSLRNPDSGLDAIRMDDGGYLAVVNGSPVDRSNLQIVFSRDEGKTWRTIAVLEDKPGMEYSYPSIARGADGLYHITYTYERKRIKHVAFNEAWIRERERD